MNAAAAATEWAPAARRSPLRGAPPRRAPRPLRPPRTGTPRATAPRHRRPPPFAAGKEPIGPAPRRSARRFSLIGGKERCLSTEPPGQLELRRSLPALCRCPGQSKAHDSPSRSGIGGAAAPHVLLTGAPGGAAPPLPSRPSAALETWLFLRVGRAGPAARTTRRAGRGGRAGDTHKSRPPPERNGLVGRERPCSPGGLRERGRGEGRRPDPGHQLLNDGSWPPDCTTLLTRTASADCERSLPASRKHRTTVQRSRAALNSESPALRRKVRPYRTEISLGNDNRVFVKISPHCSKTGVPTQGKQKETFPALKNPNRIREVGNKTSQSCTELKKKSQQRLFCCANKKRFVV
ncbi:uncharacterized protein LJ206_010255 [Theristicus caerulescens]